MKTRNSITILLLLFLGTTKAVLLQENLDQFATKVVDKVEESKEKCCEACHDLVEVICETREEWWTALLTWLRSLGGSKGICDILQRLLDFTNSLIHLVNCSLSSNPEPECPGTFLANQLAWLEKQDVTNTDQLNFTSKALLTTLVIFAHLAFSTLILALILPFICNYVVCFKTKVDEVLATRRTRSTRRTHSARRTTSTRRTRSARRKTTRRRSTRKATPAGRTPSSKGKLGIFPGAQVAGSGNLDLGGGKRKANLEDAKVTGYEGYNKKSFLELPTTANKASEQSSSSASDEPVKIVIKEDIRKRPASKKSSSKKSSS